MKKVLALFTMVSFCLVALNVQAIDKNNLKKQKAKANKTIKSATNLKSDVKSEFKGQKAVYLKDLKSKKVNDR